ncbi:MAG: hypothetical protein VW104_02185 [Halieaceae bacterium]
MHVAQLPADKTAMAAMCSVVAQSCTPKQQIGIDWRDLLGKYNVVQTPLGTATDCSTPCNSLYSNGVCAKFAHDTCALVEPGSPLTAATTLYNTLAQTALTSTPVADTWVCTTSSPVPNYNCAKGVPPVANAVRVKIGFAGDFCPTYTPSKNVQVMANAETTCTVKQIVGGTCSTTVNDKRELRIWRVPTAFVNNSGFTTSEEARKANGLVDDFNPKCPDPDSGAACLPGVCKILTMSYYNDPAADPGLVDTVNLVTPARRNVRVVGNVIHVLGYSQCDPEFGTRVVEYVESDEQRAPVESPSAAVLASMATKVANRDGVGNPLWPTHLALPAFADARTPDPDPPYMYPANEYEFYMLDTQNNPRPNPKQYTCGGKSAPPTWWLEPTNTDPNYDFVMKKTLDTAAFARAANVDGRDGMLKYDYRDDDAPVQLFDPTHVACSQATARAVTGHVTLLDNCAAHVNGTAHGHFGVMRTRYSTRVAYVTGYPQMVDADGNFLPGAFGRHMQVLGVVFPPTLAADFNDNGREKKNYDAAKAAIKKMNERIEFPVETEWNTHFHTGDTCNPFSNSPMGCAWLPKQQPTGWCPARRAASLGDAIILPQNTAASPYGTELLKFDNHYACTDFWYAHAATSQMYTNECGVARSNLDARRVATKRMFGYNEGTFSPPLDFLGELTWWVGSNPWYGNYWADSTYYDTNTQNPNPRLNPETEKYTDAGWADEVVYANASSARYEGATAENLMFRIFTTTPQLKQDLAAADLAPTTLPFALSVDFSDAEDAQVDIKALHIAQRQYRGGGQSIFPPLDAEPQPMSLRAVDVMRIPVIVGSTELCRITVEFKYVDPTDNTVKTVTGAAEYTDQTRMDHQRVWLPDKAPNTNGALTTTHGGCGRADQVCVYDYRDGASVYISGGGGCTFSTGLFKAVLFVVLPEGVALTADATKVREDDVVDDLRCMKNGTVNYVCSNRKVAGEWNAWHAEHMGDAFQACPSYQCSLPKNVPSAKTHMAKTRSLLLRDADVAPTDTSVEVDPQYDDDRSGGTDDERTLMGACTCCSHGDLWDVDWFRAAGAQYTIRMPVVYTKPKDADCDAPANEYDVAPPSVAMASEDRVKYPSGRAVMPEALAGYVGPTRCDGYAIGMSVMNNDECKQDKIHPSCANWTYKKTDLQYVRKSFVDTSRQAVHDAYEGCEAAGTGVCSDLQGLRGPAVAAFAGVVQSPDFAAGRCGAVVMQTFAETGFDWQPRSERKLLDKTLDESNSRALKIVGGAIITDVFYDDNGGNYAKDAVPSFLAAMQRQQAMEAAYASGTKPPIEPRPRWTDGARASDTGYADASLKARWRLLPELLEMPMRLVNRRETPLQVVKDVSDIVDGGEGPIDSYAKPYYYRAQPVADAEYHLVHANRTAVDAWYNARRAVIVDLPPVSQASVIFRMWGLQEGRNVDVLFATFGLPRRFVGQRSVEDFAWFDGTAALSGATEAAVKQVAVTNLLDNAERTTNFQPNIVHDGTGPPQSATYTSSMKSADSCMIPGSKPFYACDRALYDEAVSTDAAFAAIAYGIAPSDKLKAALLVRCGYRWEGADDFGLRLSGGGTTTMLSVDAYEGNLAPLNDVDQVMGHQPYRDLALTSTSSRGVTINVYPGTCLRWPHGAHHIGGFDNRSEAYRTYYEPYIENVSGRQVTYSKSVMLSYCEQVRVRSNPTDAFRTVFPYVANDYQSVADRIAFCAQPDAQTVEGGIELPPRTLADSCNAVVCLFVPGFTNAETLSDFLHNAGDLTNKTVLVMPIPARTFKTGFYMKRARLALKLGERATQTPNSAQSDMFLLLVEILQSETAGTIKDKCTAFFDSVKSESGGVDMPSYRINHTLSYSASQLLLNGTDAVVRYRGMTIDTAVRGRPLTFGKTKKGRSHVRIWVGAPDVRVGPVVADQTGCNDGGILCTIVALVGEDVSGSQIARAQHASEETKSPTIMILGGSTPFFQHQGRRLVNAHNVVIGTSSSPKPLITAFDAAISSAAGDVAVCGVGDGVPRVLVEGFVSNIVAASNCTTPAIINLTAVEDTFSRDDVEALYHRPAGTSGVVYAMAGVLALGIVVALVVHVGLFVNPMFAMRFLVVESKVDLDAGVTGSTWRTKMTKRGVVVVLDAAKGERPIELASIDVIARVLGGGEGGCTSLSAHPTLVAYVLERSRS